MRCSARGVDAVARPVKTPSVRRRAMRAICAAISYTLRHARACHVDADVSLYVISARHVHIHQRTI